MPLRMEGGFDAPRSKGVEGSAVHCAAPLAKCDEAVPCRYYWPGSQRVLRHNTQRTAYK